ncbi:hypothetical protein AQUCO_05200016v1 [Aquilegia coerulea]|uniref:TTF-type domain-containing protein n=1 Tax=Aquilegia coerulea TaxID=218851 RepID=A0A2G5CJX1_AQUCA|nr:hypothetical protein AQUCO_05200016v1 [Aquilegia coerulea]
MDKFVIRLPRTSVPPNLEPIVSNVPKEPVSVEPIVPNEPVVTNTKRIKRTSDGEESFAISSFESNPSLRKPISDYPPDEQDNIRRAYLVKGPCQPNHDFPLTAFGDQNRGFSKNWYTYYGSWIEYSISKDAAFCLYCYLFKKDRGADAFRLQEHVGLVNSAHNKAYMFGQNLLNQNQSIVTAITKQTDQARIAYKDRLEASIKVVRLLLELGLPFRGHDESEDSMSKGKFHTCLRFLVENNQEAKNVQKNTPGSAKMTAPTIQKDIVKACALETVEAIRRDMGDPYFALLVDESRDVFIKEQMVVAVRYLDKKGQTTSIALKKAIENLFSMNNLSISKLHGQGYDGASNMRGEYNGLKSLILQDNKYAYFIHCFAHQLQLTLVHVAKHFTHIITLTGSSCKRKDQLVELQLEQILKEVESGERLTGRGLNQETSLRRAAETRWETHYESILRIISMYNAVLNLLRIIEVDGITLDSRKKAESLGYTMNTFDFVFKLHMMRKVLGITNTLSKALQKKDQDIVNAMDNVNLWKARFKSLRESGWDDLLLEVNSFCEKNEISIPNLNDTYAPPGQSRRLIAHQAMEFDDYFLELATELIFCVGRLSPAKSFSAFDKKKLVQLATFYEVDFSSLDLLVLDDQLDMYYLDMTKNIEFSGLNEIGKLSIKMVETKKSLVYPQVYRLITLALILPVATATVERAFSAMKLVKSEPRNRMGDGWMSDFLLTFIEKDIFWGIDIKIVAKRFQNMHPRRQQLPLDY